MNVRVVLPVAITLGYLAFYGFPKALDHEFAAASTPARTTASVEQTYQGLTVRQWAARAVANRRGLNKAHRTIRRLQHAQLTASAHFFNWLAAADCVHSHEGGWGAHTGNGYYGGFQADISFQRAYAPDLIRRYGGWAHTWPWFAQTQMAYRGWLFRGWQPWPATSRMCGLR